MKYYENMNRLKENQNDIAGLALNTQPTDCPEWISIMIY